jgi:hypothetical protein
MSDSPTTNLSVAESDVIAERRRQVSTEGWVPEHDDEHRNGELVKAAACYAISGSGADVSSTWSHWWPWHPRWWKTEGGQRRQLVKAAALIIAEIERIDRSAARVPNPDPYGLWGPQQ